MNLIEKLHSRGLIKPPNHVLGGMQYLVMMGSVSYKVINKMKQNLTEFIYFCKKVSKYNG